MNVITIKQEMREKENLLSINFQSNKKEKQQIDKKKNTSPNRFTKKVNIPATDLL
jgi:hypothetical protein